ncbi:MAG: hydroxypyruvate reductase [Thermotogaceae bacterium]|jgi:D-3-phosphoglycerate dehydrogenase|nr:hydroxypyruvate reductase [Thermotogaceae bacterium]MDN5337682.1 hydroxypyruvate reductase [Thermotogaceae bacterium]
MIRLHINDPIDKAAYKMLEDSGKFEITMEYLEKEKLLEAIPEIEVLLVRSATKVTKEIIETGKNLKIIARAGTGLDNIDVEAAKEKGIKVLNTPGANSISVAELTIGLMIAASRFIPQGTQSLKEGKWEKKRFKGFELYEKRLGIIGYGKIGREVAKRAKAFDMKIYVYDVVKPENLEGFVEFVEFEQLIKSSDYITLHVPFSEKTKHMINKNAFDLMKDGAILINAARGGVVDEEALYSALISGKLRAAALDVFEVEPPVDDLRKKLLSLENVIATPHIGASTEEAQKRVGIEIAKKIIENI